MEKIVRDCNKQRFSFNDDKTKIRANQGHSIKVDLELKAERPPRTLYHGTSKRSLDLILTEGLKKMNRTHVHLSSDVDTAIIVGSRRKDKLIILKINTQWMYVDGIKFYESKNGVWLTNVVDKKYIEIWEN